MSLAIESQTASVNTVLYLQATKSEYKNIWKHSELHEAGQTMGSRCGIEKVDDLH